MPFPSVLEAGSQYPVIVQSCKGRMRVTPLVAQSCKGYTSGLVDEHLLAAPIHPRGVSLDAPFRKGSLSWGLS